jgi:TolB-like protein
MALPPTSEALARNGGEPEAAEIISALTTVLASGSFTRAPSSRGFLAYVVTETLAGRGDRLSERTVGRHALRQADSFDGSAASVVRVRATRVRAALAEYYAADGRDDPVRIVLSSGSYRPTFERRPSDDGVPEDLAAGVVVLRFAHDGADPASQIALALSDALGAKLEEFPGLAVVGPTTGAALDEPSAAAVRLGLRFVLHGSVVVRDDQVRLTARLTDALTRLQVWRGASTRPVHHFTGFDVEDEWALSVAGELGDWAGVINRVERESGSRGGTASYRGHLSFCAYQDNPVPEAIRTAERDLDAAIGAGGGGEIPLAVRGWT